jgi:hypothetical protein
VYALLLELERRLTAIDARLTKFNSFYGRQPEDRI